MTQKIDRMPVPKFESFELYRHGIGWQAIAFELLCIGDYFRRVGDDTTRCYRALSMPKPCKPDGNMTIDCEPMVLFRGADPLQARP